jgi:serine acetyltransferase
MLVEKPRLPLRAMLTYGWLPSPLKKAYYRLKGYEIGKGVRFGLGSIIDAPRVVVGDFTRLGFLSFIRGTSVRLGAHVQIGATTMIDTPHVEIGDGTRINEQVFVGGLQSPDSRLTIGRNCQIMQMTFINPARSITIGDDTGIGGDCLVFGHTSWLSKFEGYPVEFDSIVIGSSVSIAWRVFVVPGTRIGDGAVVGANSLVRGQIPPRCLAVGFPARVVSSAPAFPRVVSDEEKRGFLGEIVTELVAYLGQSGFVCRPIGSTYEIADGRRRLRGRRRWRLHVEYDAVAPDQTFDVDAASVLVSLKPLPASVREKLERDGAMWIDVDSKERSDSGNDVGEEVAQYLRRYGVRLLRVRRCGDRVEGVSECVASRVS